jgi:hypothetical protein
MQLEAVEMESHVALCSRLGGHIAVIAQFVGLRRDVHVYQKRGEGNRLRINASKWMRNEWFKREAVDKSKLVDEDRGVDESQEVYRG